MVVTIKIKTKAQIPKFLLKYKKFKKCKFCGRKIPRGRMCPSCKFHSGIRNLFENAGFTVVECNYLRKGPDMIIEAEGFRIIVQCKRALKKRLFPSINRLIDEYSTKRQKKNARIAILAISTYVLPKEYLVQEKRKELLEMDKVIIWDDRIIDYYKRLVKAIGEYAKYTILGDFGIKEEFSSPISIPALKVKQNDEEFVIFKITPDILLKIAYVFRREYSPGAYQRMLNPARLKKELAEKFLDEPDAILPTNIVCVLEDGINFDEKTKMLTIPMKFHSVWIIDGQHRLYAFCHLKNVRKREEFELLCAGFDGTRMPIASQGKMFVDINQKAKQVSPLLLLDLYDLIGVKDRRVEIVKELAKTKIFADKIQFPGKKAPISMVTFATTSAMDKLVKNGGILSKYYQKGSEAMEEKFQEFCVKVLKTYFRIVSEVFKEEWKDSENYILARDRGIRGLLRLFPVILDYAQGVNEDKIKECLKALKGFKLGTVECKGKYAGEGGADDLLKEWCEHIRKTIPDFAPIKREVIQEIIIYPNQKKQAENFIKKWFSKLRDLIYGQLTYIDETTFDYLRWIPKPCEIKLIVSVIKDKDKCYEIAEKMKSDGWNLQIHIVEIPQKIPSEGAKLVPWLHERWLADENFEIDFGHDLKKSALGSRQHTIRVLGKSGLKEKITKFKKLWEVPPIPIQIKPFFPNTI